ncbi:hypothetical protein R3P38DRAFT_2990586 [Favolaschia claudopus]|uniref:PWWP domain-containing protein n=1 Tax=Favolaschia claudopus TaxID=2862362 RepID=A0AAV9YZK3_9AGAR
MDLARNPIVPGDFVLAKLKGYPSWPAMVVFPETLPEQVACARHCAASHAVMFYPDCDFAWVETAQIQLIRARLLEKPNLVNKRKKLQQGYKAAHQALLQQIRTRRWRFQLQRTFLDTQVPSMENIVCADRTLTKIEEKHVDITEHDLIASSILHKELCRLPPASVIGDDHYRFRLRAMKLVEQWLKRVT